MTDLRKDCTTCRFLQVSGALEPCRMCRLLPSGEWTEWQPTDDTYTHPVVGKVHVHPTPGVASDFEAHPPGTAKRLAELEANWAGSSDTCSRLHKHIAQLEQEVAACERRLADMAREMQKFMDEAQQRR